MQLLIDGKIRDITLQKLVVNNKDLYEKTILPLYKIYQQKLIDLNSCDFGDLILHTVKILENYPDIRKFTLIILNIF